MQTENVNVSVGNLSILLFTYTYQPLLNLLTFDQQNSNI